MVQSWWRVSSFVLALTFVCSSAASSQDASLLRAEALIEAEEYVAAQEVLLSLDPESLDSEDQQRMLVALEVVGEAIPSVLQAGESLELGMEAYDRGEWDASSDHFESVLAQRFATRAQREAAGRHLEQIAEKRELDAALSPAGPVGEPGADELDDVDGAGNPLDVPAAERMESARPRSLVDTLRERDELFWNRAVARASDQQQQARDAALENDFRLAIELADAAIQQIESARRYAVPLSRYEAQLAAAQRTRQDIRDAADEYNRVVVTQQREEILRQESLRRSQQEQERQELIDQLFARADVERSEQRYGDMVGTYREILLIDPANGPAKVDLRWAEELYNIADYRHGFDDARTNIQAVHGRALGELLDPGNEEFIVYPDDWVERSRKRGRFDDGGSPSEETHRSNLALEELLSQSVARLEFESELLSDVIADIVDRFGINLNADWVELDAFGIDRDFLVEDYLAVNTDVQTVLELLINNLSPGDLALDYRSNSVWITVPEARTVYPRSYNIRHMLPQTEIQQERADDIRDDELGVGGGGGGGGGDEDLEELAEDIEELIPQLYNIDAPSWTIRDFEDDDNTILTPGIADVQIDPLNSILTVFQTYPNHRQIQAYFDAGRDARLLPQVAYETRFLTLTNNFLEEIGVDLDFVFNQAGAGFDPAQAVGGGALVDPFTGAPILIDRRFSRGGFFAAPPGAVGTPLTAGGVPAQPFNQAAFVPPGSSRNNWTPIGVGQDSISLTAPNTLSTGITGSFTDTTSSAINIAGTFLDNLQVDFLIRATQANRRSSIVQSPRLLVSDFGSAGISITRVFDYVASLDAQVAEDAVALTPQTQQTTSGTTLRILDVRISSDYAYVTSQVLVEVNDDPTFTTFTVQQGSAVVPSSFIQLIDQPTNLINTEVSIPDGGTVLLGGLKRAAEIEVDAGVPVLSKIPVLKRAFTNTTTVQDTQTLLILIKASVLVPEEIEEEAFGTLLRSE